jgi:hypothetical protein
MEKLKKEMEENARKQIEQNEREMESMKQTYEQKLAEALSKVIHTYSILSKLFFLKSDKFSS